MDEVLRLGAEELRQIYEILFEDKTTGRRIVWGTGSYSEYGEMYGKDKAVTASFDGLGEFAVEPRIKKEKKRQQERTRSYAEVFSPAWVCNKMINYCDDDWFGRQEVFNTEGERSWKVNENKIEFSDKKDWKAYVDSRRLEITCGEAPFIVSRYDVSTGEEIEIEKRIGILDRKLRVVGENCESEEEWLEWAARAFQSVYGYEMQGDSLILCRKNLLLTFGDYLKQRWNREPTLNELKKTANIIAWNFWQMDGLKGTVPLDCAVPEDNQLSIDDFLEGSLERKEKSNYECKIRNWRSGKTFLFKEAKEKGFMKFDYVIGNPPYQETKEGTSDAPVYNYFMDASFGVADKVELITPARFFFNAGKTPKSWNKKMLEDEHFKVLFHEQDSSKIFPNTDIKGGVAITYRDNTRILGKLGTYTSFAELNSILKKVNSTKYTSLSEFIYSPESYRFSKLLHSEKPNVKEKLSDGHLYDITSNIFDKLSDIVFFDEKPNDEHEYIQIIGRKKNNRTYMWIRKDYILQHENLLKYKLFLPKSNGSGAIGEVLSTPLIGEPLIGHTQTFISIGAFNTKNEAENALKYIKSKFARTMLGVLKVTQDNKKAVWKYVPMQDFTENSDIDWSGSVAEIDRQLYRKYGLSEEEISFIETHVKEME